MSKKIIIASIVFAIELCCFAQAEISVPGSTIFPTASPRIIAMGGAYVAVADDANAVFLNPAGLGENNSNDLSLCRNLKWTRKFSPFNSALPGSAILSYYLTRAADTTIEVKNSNGEVVYKLVDEKLPPKGRKEYDFESYDSKGNILFDGKYTFNIRLDDHANTPESYVRKFVIDHAPHDFLLITTTTEAISPTKAYTLSWTSASPYGPKWNHLREYEILGKRIDQSESGDFRVLKKGISPEATSATVNLIDDSVWQIKIRAIDREGNWRDSDRTNSTGYTGEPIRLLTVKVDTVPPARFNLSCPKEGEIFESNDVLIKWNSAQDDNLDYYEVIVKNIDAGKYAAPEVYRQEIPATASREVLLQNLNKGEHHIYITAFDKAGNYRKYDGKTGNAKTPLEKLKIIENAYLRFVIKNRLPTPYDGLTIPSERILKTFSPEALAKIQIDNIRNIAANSKTMNDGYGKIIGDLYAGKRQIYNFNKTAKEALVKIILDKEESPKLRACAIGWLNPDDPPEAFDAMKLIYKDKKEPIELRRCAFGNIDSTKRPEKQKEAIDVLIEALKGEDDNVAGTAANGLDRLKDKKAIGPLIEAVKMSRERYKVLLRSGWKDYEKGSTNAGMRLCTAMRALGTLRAEEAIPLLIEVMNDLDFDHERDLDSINGFAAMALGEIGDTGALPAINQALEEKKYKSHIGIYDALSNAKEKIEKGK